MSPKNENIKKPYDILQIISKDEKARMLYEAREAELKDQLTRAKEYEDKGRMEGRIEGERAKAVEVARNLLGMGMDVEKIVQITGLCIEEVEMIKGGMQ